MTTRLPDAAQDPASLDFEARHGTTAAREPSRPERLAFRRPDWFGPVAIGAGYAHVYTPGGCRIDEAAGVVWIDDFGGAFRALRADLRQTMTLAERTAAGTLDELCAVLEAAWARHTAAQSAQEAP